MKTPIVIKCKSAVYPPPFVTTLFIMVCISLNISSAFGQHISTKTVPDPYSDIYHLGGYLGVGVQPSELLHIHSGSSSAVIRISQDDTGEVNYWDIVNSSGDFSYQFHSGLNSPAIQMLLTSDGQLALGTEAPHESAIFQADADDKGILIPRLTTEDIGSINNKATGLLVYNTTAEAFAYWDGTQWLQIAQDKQFENYLREETFYLHPASDITTENINTFAEIDALQINTLLYNDANGNLQSIIPNGTEGQILTINETGNYTWTEPQSQAETFWLQTDNYTYLKNENDNVGIGTETPQTALHIFTQSEDYATLRLHTYAINENSKSGTPAAPTMLVQKFWDFKSQGTKLAFNYGN